MAEGSSSTNESDFRVLHVVCRVAIRAKHVSVDRGVLSVDTDK